MASGPYPPWDSVADMPGNAARDETDDDVVVPFRRPEADETPTGSPAGPERRASGEPAPPLREVIGDVLRKERLGQSRTLADVAEEAAVSLPYLSEVERGVKEVSSDLLAAICDALELPLDELLDRAAREVRGDRSARPTFLALAA